MPDWLDVLVKLLGVVGFILAVAGIIFQAGKPFAPVLLVSLKYPKPYIMESARYIGAWTFRGTVHGYLRGMGLSSVRV